MLKLFNKIKKTTSYLIMLFILPLIISSVDCAWTYATGTATNGSIDISMTLNPFYYLLPGFPNTDSGQANSDALNNHIVGGNNGLNKPESQLNNALKDNIFTSNLPASKFITSIDTVPPCAQTGESIRASINLPSNIHYAIHKSQDNGSTQIWDVYTTDYDINKIQNINGKFTPSSIYPIYKTSYTWKMSGFVGTSGTYTKNGDTQVGYCSTAINNQNNPNKPFFNPTTFKVGEIKPVTSITISGNKDMVINEKLQLTANILPVDAADKSVIWSSSSPTIIDVNNSGLVTAYKEGSANIFAKSSNPNIASAMVTINVTKPIVVLPSSITISGPSECNVNSSIQLSATITPSNASDKTVTWSVSNNAIATINNGLLTINGGNNGDKLTITAKTVNNISATHIVTILKQNVQQPNPEWSKPPTLGPNNQVTTLPGKNIVVGTTDTLYPSTTMNQYVNFTIAPRGTATANKVCKVVIESSDPSAVIVKAQYVTTSGTIAKTAITLDANKKGFQVTGNKSSEKKVFFEIKANGPVKVTITYI